MHLVDDPRALFVMRDTKPASPSTLQSHAYTTSVVVDVLVDFVRRKAQEQGQSAAASAALAALGFAQGRAPDARVAMADFRQLWLLAAQYDSAIGLHASLMFAPEQMHLVAHIVTRCATLGEGLAQWCHFAQLICGSDNLHLSVRGDQAEMAYTSLAAVDMPWMAEHYACMLRACLRRYLQVPADLQALAFAHAPLAALDLYQERLGCTPRFGATRHVYTFDSKLLAQPLAKADAYLRHYLQLQASGRMPSPALPAAALGQSTQFAQSTATQAMPERCRVLAVLALGKQQVPELASIAQELQMSESAFQRALHRQDTHFREVLDDAKREVACTLLQTSMGLAQISERLGFAEPSVLQRACKRWFGMSAAKARQALRGLA